MFFPPSGKTTKSDFFQENTNNKYVTPPARPHRNEGYVVEEADGGVDSISRKDRKGSRRDRKDKTCIRLVLNVGQHRGSVVGKLTMTLLAKGGVTFYCISHFALPPRLTKVVITLIYIIYVSYP